MVFLVIVAVAVAFLLGIALAWSLASRLPTAASHPPERRFRHRDPPPFAGKPADFKEWLFAVEEAVRISRPTDTVGYVASYLEGSARRWLINLWEQEGRAVDWAQFRRSLRGAFELKHEEERNRLQVVRAKQTGGLEEYISEYTALCLSARHMDELTKALLFTEGLADSLIRKEVRQQHPETLADAVRHARTASDSASSERTRLPPSGNSGYELREMRRLPQRGPQLPPAERMRLVRENRCFRCKEVGHIARECRLRHPNASRQ